MPEPRSESLCTMYNLYWIPLNTIFNKNSLLWKYNEKPSYSTPELLRKYLHRNILYFDQESLELQCFEMSTTTATVNNDKLLWCVPLEYTEFVLKSRILEKYIENKYCRNYYDYNAIYSKELPYQYNYKKHYAYPLSKAKKSLTKLFQDRQVMFSIYYRRDNLIDIYNKISKNKFNNIKNISKHDNNTINDQEM